MDSVDFSNIFAASPAPYLLLSTDSDYKILAVNDAYLAATMTTREQLIGRPLFEAFPDNPADPRGGVLNLRASPRSCAKPRHRSHHGVSEIRHPSTQRRV